MRLQTRNSKGALGAEITLPPPFSLVALREVGDAFAHASTVAAQSGAGTLVYVGRFDVAEFAVVLEPDEPLRTARRALYAGMSALAATIAAYAPPDLPINIGWPDALQVNYGLVGGARLGWPEGAPEDEPPEWLVFGAMIRVASLIEDPGLHPNSTALEQEGFDDFHASHLVESFARHLMSEMDSWQEFGFGSVARNYIGRLQLEPGTHGEIADNGDLLLRRGKDVERRSLVKALRSPSWLDPETKEPRL